MNDKINEFLESLEFLCKLYLEPIVLIEDLQSYYVLVSRSWYSSKRLQKLELLRLVSAQWIPYVFHLSFAEVQGIMKRAISIWIEVSSDLNAIVVYTTVRHATRFLHWER